MVKISARSVRYTFSAPIADKQIEKWIQSQSNLSTSVRLVIKDYIARHGMIDVACMPFVIDEESADKYKAIIANGKIEETSVSEPVKANVSVPIAQVPSVQEQQPVATQTNSQIADMLADLMN